MRFLNLAGAVLVVVSSLSGMALAQTSSGARVPAEFPPASYKGTQYVDSVGCVYIRAGVDGVTTWVPRVSRSRKPVCNQAPTRISGATPTAPSAPGVEQITLETTAPKDAPRTAAVAPAPRPAPATRPKAVVVAPKPKPVVVPPAQPKAAERVIPAHVALTRLDERDFTVPEGYRSAWSDDRLNVRRTEGTRAGWHRMNLVWTQTVPRRLIDKRNGRDVTATVPLVYPYTDTATQSAELGTVTLGSMGGKVVKRIHRNAGATAPVRSESKALEGARYVQVAMFGVSTNAQATAHKLAQSGLPMRMGKLTRGGKTYQLVLAGPFTDAKAARRALQVARRAGFADAYIRN